MNRPARKLGAVAALLLVAACTGGDDTGDTTNRSTVTIAGFTYSPSPVTIAAGATVTWTNGDDILHTVTSGTPEAPTRGPLDGTLDGPGTTYERTFSDAGTFEYFCARHNGMRGTVIVT